MIRIRAGQSHRTKTLMVPLCLEWSSCVSISWYCGTPSRRGIQFHCLKNETGVKKKRKSDTNGPRVLTCFSRHFKWATRKSKRDKAGSLQYAVSTSLQLHNNVHIEFVSQWRWPNFESSGVSNCQQEFNPSLQWWAWHFQFLRMGILFPCPAKWPDHNLEPLSCFLKLGLLPLRGTGIYY